MSGRISATLSYRKAINGLVGAVSHKQNFNKMGIFDFFSSKTDKEKLSHIKMLVVLAMADGKVEKNELAAISTVCSREGVSASEIKNILENPESIDFVPPTIEEKKLRYLKDMCLLMMADRNIDENEIAICKLTAEALGYRHEVIDAMVDGIINDLRAKMEEINGL